MKKVISLFMAVLLLISMLTVSFSAVTVSTAATGEYDFELDPNKLYFDTNGTGWDMSKTSYKVAFHIFGGDLTNGLAWGAKKAIGTATSGQSGIFQIDPAAKLGLTLNEGVQYKIIFVRTEGANWKEQTYDLLFTTDCLGHIAYCDGTQYENPVDSSKKTFAAFWDGMDASYVGPVKQISSIGNVVGTCLAEGTTDESLFNDFLTVVDGTTKATKFQNAYKFVVEAGNKTEQQMIDDIGAGLGLTKDDIQAAFDNHSMTLGIKNENYDPDDPDSTEPEYTVEPTAITTAWSYDDSALPAGETPHTHTPAEPVQENVVPASCTAEGSYDEVVYCSECGEELSREQKTIDKIAHTPGEAVRENEKPATCTAEGSYDEVVYCTVCNEELSREQKTIDKIDHTPGEAVRENEKPATCTAEGSYDEVVYCTVCNEELSRETKTIDKLAHTPGEAVRENEIVSHDNTAYDLVVYCTECGEEISRTPTEEPIITHTLTYIPEVPATEEAEGVKAHYVCSGCDKLFSDATGDVEITAADLVIPKLTHTHTPGEAVRENEVPASCKAEGSYDMVVYCTACGEELSRETFTIDKLAHTPGEAVRKNEVPASCEAEGSYDEVVYCTVCGEELSRETKTIEKTAHTLKFKPSKKATEEAEGWRSHFECTVCGKYFGNANGANELTWDQIVIPKLTPATEPPTEPPVPTEPEVKGKLGDADNSGEVDIVDVTFIQRVLAGMKPATDEINKLGDVDKNGKLESIDATRIQRWLLGLEQTLGIGSNL